MLASLRLYLDIFFQIYGLEPTLGAEWRKLEPFLQGLKVTDSKKHSSFLEYKIDYDL